MKKNRSLMLLVGLIIIVSGITHAHVALAMSDKIIKQRIEDDAADTLSPVSYTHLTLPTNRVAGGGGGGGGGG